MEIAWQELGIGTAVGTVSMATVRYLLGRRKSNADAAVVVARAWEALLQPLRDENERRVKEHAVCEAKNRELEELISHHRLELYRLTQRIEVLETTNTELIEQIKGLT